MYIELAKKKLSAAKSFKKYYTNPDDFKELSFDTIEEYFNKEDELDEKISELAKLSHIAKKEKDSAEVKRLKAEIKKLSEERKEVRKLSKLEMDKHAQFNRAAKPYVDAEKLLKQQENFAHFNDIEALYEEAKIAAEEEDRLRDEEIARKKAEEAAELERRKLEKAAKKNK